MYGDLALDDPKRFTEDTPYRPSSPYSAAKAGSDHLVRAWVRSFGVRATISNCSNNYGPWQHVEKFIPRQVTELLEGRRPRVYGNGQQVRDWIHVDDHSRRLLADPRARPDRRDLPGRRRRRAQQPRGGAPAAAADGPPRGRRTTWSPTGPGTTSATRSRPASSALELGWQPRFGDLEQGLADTVAWYTDHRDWWAPHKARHRGGVRREGPVTGRPDGRARPPIPGLLVLRLDVRDRRARLVRGGLAAGRR